MKILPLTINVGIVDCVVFDELNWFEGEVDIGAAFAFEAVDVATGFTGVVIVGLMFGDVTEGILLIEVVTAWNVVTGIVTEIGNPQQSSVYQYIWSYLTAIDFCQYPCFLSTYKILNSKQLRHDTTEIYSGW